MQQATCLLLPHPTGITSSGHHPTGAARPGVQQGTALDISELDAAVERFLGSGIAPSTRSMYKSAQRRYSNFCIKYGIQDPYPLREDRLCSYVAFLAEEGLKHRTIKAYLAGIRCLQIHKALGNPFAHGSMPRLEYVLSGIKRVEAHSGIQARSRLPITIDIMGKFRDMWLTSPPHPDCIMLWAAACVGFFSFLQAGEFTVPSAEAYDPDAHLNLNDLTLESHSDPSMARLHIKQSKTDPFQQGVEIFLGKTGTSICPVQAIVHYIGVHSSSQGLLFIFGNGIPLTRAQLVMNVQAALRTAGVDSAGYTGHSFHIGAATTAAQQGLEDSLIQTLGRWRSDAYKVYIRLPRAQLANVSRTLAQHH